MPLIRSTAVWSSQTSQSCVSQRRISPVPTLSGRRRRTHPIARNDEELIVIPKRCFCRVGRSYDKLLHARIAQTARDGEYTVDTVIHDETAGVRDALDLLHVGSLVVVRQSHGFSAAAIEGHNGRDGKSAGVGYEEQKGRDRVTNLSTARASPTLAVYNVRFARFFGAAGSFAPSAGGSADGMLAAADDVVLVVVVVGDALSLLPPNRLLMRSRWLPSPNFRFFSSSSGASARSLVLLSVDAPASVPVPAAGETS